MANVLNQQNASEIFQPPHRLSEEPIAEGETWLIYGGSKCGKTWVAGTAGDRSLFINIGEGIKTIQSPLFKKLVGANPLIQTFREEYDEYGICQKATLFDNVSRYIDYALDNFGNDFDWVVVDDATSLNTGALHKGLEENQANNRSQTLSTIKRTHVFTTTIQDYQAEMNLVDQFLYGTISLLKSKGKHFVLTAHTRETYIKEVGAKIGDAKKLKSIRPAFTGEAFPDYIQGLFDNVIKMEAVGGGSNTVYRAITAGDEIVTAGMRCAGVFEGVERDPNLLKFIERIRKNELHPKHKDNK